MSMFFSVHYLTIYYLLQPYNAGTEMKSGTYRIVSAYLSWDAARRVAEGGEDLRLIPTAIGGDPEKRT